MAGANNLDEEEGLPANFEQPNFISYLKLPAIKAGKGYIYPLWKDRLNAWLSQSDCEVYLATPFVDIKRMTDICDIVIKNSDTANIGAFFVRENCYNDPFNNIHMNITEVIEAALKKFPEEKYNIIHEKISKKIARQKEKQYFHAKFIGCKCTSKDEAWVLVTSANFTGSHFDCQNYESVGYNEMKRGDFHERFIDPLRSITNKKE